MYCIEIITNTYLKKSRKMFYQFYLVELEINECILKGAKNI